MYVFDQVAIALQGSQEREELYSELNAGLTKAYVRLGGALICDGRFTRALQHFKQGVHLFDSVQAKGGVAACFCCLGTLFIFKTTQLDAAQLQTLTEREFSGRESLRHFEMALQVCVSSLLLGCCICQVG
jgi:hypothetical protein